MTSRTSLLTSCNALLSGVLALVILAQGGSVASGSVVAQVRIMLDGERADEQQLHPSAPDKPSESALRIADRLHRRLEAHSGSSPSVIALARAVEQRRALLRLSTDVSLTMPDGTVHTIWTASAQRYPLWIVPSITSNSASFSLDLDRVRDQLMRDNILQLDHPQDAVLVAVEDAKGLWRATTTGVAREGYALDVDAVLRAVHDAFLAGQRFVDVPLLYRPGEIVNSTDMDLGELKLLATGRSNFEGSGWGRVANVRKALREHVNNVLVPADAIFSFNDSLGGPVTYSRGWSEAKVIFNGSELRDAPGGGICQASTTTYRAALLAGLPVIKRANHSLYVSYYEAHGVGIDATVFPGKQDLTFRNDTGHPILIQSYDDGFEAYVSIYGTPDGRQVELTGPYFSVNAPDDYLVNGKTLRSNEIGWLHRVVYPDGRNVVSHLVSRYSGMPRSLAQKHSTVTSL